MEGSFSRWYDSIWVFARRNAADICASKSYPSFFFHGDQEKKRLQKRRLEIALNVANRGTSTASSSILHKNTGGNALSTSCEYSGFWGQLCCGAIARQWAINWQFLGGPPWPGGVTSRPSDHRHTSKLHRAPGAVYTISIITWGDWLHWLEWITMMTR